ncbi:hypothetical protein [Phaeobacter phage MD18]|nr:hypothetical protein [Phaeobacter phage MD18]
MDKYILGFLAAVFVVGLTAGAVIRAHIAFDICKTQGRSTAACVFYALR